MPRTHSILSTQRNRDHGFTLIELLFTLAIVAILLAVAAPSMQNTVIKNSVSSHQKKLRSILQHARSVAVDRGVDVVACDSTNGTSCNDPATTWEGGWMTFVDNDSDGVMDAGDDEILSVQRSVGNSVTISLDNTISFRSSGYLSDDAEFKFCHNNNDAKYARALILTQVGIARNSLDSDSDGIHEGSAGELSCP